MSRMRENYKNNIVPGMIKKFGYTNPMEVPKLDKIVINMGVGEAKENPKALEGAITDLTAIAGQKPIITKAKKSIANFKVREGMQIGCKVTLRGEKMYDFADRLISLALPRVRDFRGVSKSSLSSRKSATTRSTRSAVWTSSLLPLRKPMRKPKNCWLSWECPL